MLTDLYIESVFRLDYQDDVEWDAWKKAFFACVGNPIDLFQDRIFEHLCNGLSFQEICANDKLLYTSKLDKNILNPPQIFI